jgi:hypothetical protein
MRKRGKLTGVIINSVLMSDYSIEGVKAAISPS